MKKQITKIILLLLLIVTLGNTLVLADGEQNENAEEQNVAEEQNSDTTVEPHI